MSYLQDISKRVFDALGISPDGFDHESFGRQISQRIPSRYRQVQMPTLETLKQSIGTAIPPLQIAQRLPQIAQTIRDYPRPVDYFLPKAQDALQGAARSIDFAGIGRKLQQFPEFDTITGPILTHPVSKQQFPIFGPIQMVPGIASSQIQSYGRTLERVATPEGRKEIVESGKRIAKQPFRLETLEEPAFEAALDISDFLPGGLFFAGGVKALGKRGVKEVAEKGVRELAEKEAKEVTLRTFAQENAEIIRRKPELWKKLQVAWNETFARVKNTPETFQSAFTDWINVRESAKSKATQYASQFVDIPEHLGPDIIKYMESPRLKASDEVKQYASILRREFNKLYKRAWSEGMNTGFVKDYVTHIWTQGPEEIRHLAASQGFKFGRGRRVPTYKEGIELGLTPRFTHPSQIIGEYMRRLEEAKANIGLVQTLKDTGLITEKRVPGFKPLDAIGFKGYATPNVADLVNDMFNPQRSGNLLSLAGKLSGAIQDIALAGGFKSVNAWSAAQVIKDVLTGHVRSPVNALLTSLSEESSTAFFKTKLPIITEMQERGIPLRTSFNYQSFFENKSINKTLTDQVGEVWHKWVNEPTFQRFMPMLQVNMYENVEKQMIKKGFAPTQAKHLAAENVKRFYGIINERALGRPQGASDAIKTFFFAPRYRESMVNLWKNLVGSFRLSQIAKPENYLLRRFALGTGIAFVVYNTLNKAFNEGKNLWNNPPGKELTLLIPTGDTTIGIPFLPSIATIPRMMASMTNYLIQGDLKKSGLESRKTLSMLIKPVLDVMANENYFGGEIYKEDDSSAEKWISSLTYIAGQWNHPYIRETINVLRGKKPLLQAVVNASEMPIRFYRTGSLIRSDFYSKLNDLEEIADKVKTLSPEKQAVYVEKHQDDLMQYVSLKAIAKSYSDLRKTERTGGIELGEQKQSITQRMQQSLQEGSPTTLAGATPQTLTDLLRQKGQRDEASTYLKGLITQGVPEETIRQQAQERGVDFDVFMVDVVKSLPTYDRAQLVNAQLKQAKDKEEMNQTFEEFVENGILTNTVVDRMVEREFLTKEEGTTFKAMIKSVKSAAKGKATGRKRKVSAPRVSFKTPSLKGYGFGASGTSKLRRLPLPVAVKPMKRLKLRKVQLPRVKIRPTERVRFPKVQIMGRTV